MNEKRCSSMVFHLNLYPGFLLIRLSLMKEHFYTLNNSNAITELESIVCCCVDY